MYITQHTDYALRALIYLGTNEDRLVTIQEILSVSPFRATT